MSDEIPFLIREPLSRPLGISNENWRQPADYRGRIDLTCGFENFLSLSTGPPSRPACLSRKPVSGLSLNSTSAPTLSPKTNNSPKSLMCERYTERRTELLARL